MVTRPRLYRTGLLAGYGLLLVSVAHAQSLDSYLKLRKKYGITAAAGVQALDNFVGTRVVEISGTVKGSFVSQGRHVLLLEKQDGSNDMVDATTVPDWLEGNEIPARLLVKATRAQAGDTLSASLIGAATDISVSAYEQEVRMAQARAEAAHRKQASRVRLTPPKTARERKLWTVPDSQVVPIYAAFIRKVNRRLSTAEALKIAHALVGFSIQYGVDARLIIAMVIAESDFDPSSTSRTGAMGLGQLMPGTARWMGVTNAYDTTDNLYGTVKLIRTHLDQYRRSTGDPLEALRLSLAAYNAGVGAVSRAGGVPQYRETQAYVKKVIKLYYSLCGIRQ